MWQNLCFCSTPGDVTVTTLYSTAHTVHTQYIVHSTYSILTLINCFTFLSLSKWSQVACVRHSSVLTPDTSDNQNQFSPNVKQILKLLLTRPHDTGAVSTPGNQQQCRQRRQYSVALFTLPAWHVHHRIYIVFIIVITNDQRCQNET